MEPSRLNDSVWITWEHQIRNQSMARGLGVELHVIEEDVGRFRRYVRCLVRTCLLLIRDRPRVVFAPNPSVVLTSFLLLVRWVFGYTLVIDAHFGGVIAYTGSGLFQRLLDLYNRCADMVIVTNEAHRELVMNAGGRTFRCEDPLPDLPPAAERTMGPGKHVLFICSFDMDEPFEAVFEAAKDLFSEGFRFWVTGNYRRLHIDPSTVPQVNLLGYVPAGEYYGLLHAVDLVVDLTSHENCLVCGAYEAMAAMKPLVTSDRIVLREYFNQGAIFTSHDVTAIAEAVRTAYDQMDRLREAIDQWTGRALVAQRERLERLRQEVIGLQDTGGRRRHETGTRR